MGLLLSLGQHLIRKGSRKPMISGGKPLKESGKFLSLTPKIKKHLNLFQWLITVLIKCWWALKISKRNRLLKERLEMPLSTLIRRSFEPLLLL
jgi:hypothetical protein